MRAARLLPSLISAVAHVAFIAYALHAWRASERSLDVTIFRATGTPRTPATRLVYLVPDARRAAIPARAPSIRRPQVPAAAVDTLPTPAPVEAALPTDAQPMSDSIPHLTPVARRTAATRGLVPAFGSMRLWQAAPTATLAAPLSAPPQCTSDRDFTCLARQYRWRRDSLARLLVGCRADSLGRTLLGPKECPPEP